jgi:hypothetical protein
MKAEKLETAILARLRQHRGSIDNSLAAWGNLLQETLGERPNEVDFVAGLKRLHNIGLLRLKKYTGHEADFYDYDEQVNVDWFFYTGTFTVAITAEGRGLDVKGSSIGFQKPA